MAVPTNLRSRSELWLQSEHFLSLATRHQHSKKKIEKKLWLLLRNLKRRWCSVLAVIAASNNTSCRPPSDEISQFLVLYYFITIILLIFEFTFVKLAYAEQIVQPFYTSCNIFGGQILEVFFCLWIVKIYGYF